MTKSASDYVLDLMSLIADPVAHKARLDELVAQEKAAQERIDAANELAAETRRLNSSAQAQNIVSDNRKKALDTREGEIEERAKQLDLATAALKKTAEEGVQKFRQRDAELAKREAAVSQREARIKDMEAEAKANADQAASLKEKLQRQAAAVQVAMTQ